MKKSIIIVVVIVVLGLIIWSIGKNGNPGDINNPSQNTNNGTSTAPTVSAPVTETTKISDKLAEYKNQELGFAVKYPTTWEPGTSASGIRFIIPTGKADQKTKTNTIARLEAEITVISGKCSFPPVTTIKERKTVVYGTISFNMISMSNSVQGSNYFDRMYSQQKGNICYTFRFSSVTESPTAKGFKGSEATQMANNNKALVESADLAFIEMVKTFRYVEGEAGIDETKVVPIKK